MTGGTTGYLCVNVLCFQYHIFVILMCPALCGCHKMSSHLNGFCTKHEGCCNPSSVCDSTSCNNRNVHCIYDLRHQNHCGCLTDMTAGFTSFCHYSIRSASLHSLCVSHRSNNRNDLYSCFFPHFHVFLRVSCTGCNHWNFFFHNYLCNLICIWTHQHNIHTKRFIGQFFYLPYLLTNPVCRSACGSNQPQPASC